MNTISDIDLFATAAYKVIVDYFDITLYHPTGDRVVFRANPLLHKRGWKREMNRRLATIRARAKIERDRETYRITVTRLGRVIGRPPLINTLLFILTFLTVLVAAAYREAGDALFSDIARLASGIPFTLVLLTILLVHEMGHFWAGHRRDIVMSYPFFIPAPTFLGTFGALIRTRTPIRSRDDLILVGAAGPLAGAVPSLIALICGYAVSDVVPLTVEPAFTFGHSLITFLAEKAIIGTVPAGMRVDLSPVALAGPLLPGR